MQSAAELFELARGLLSRPDSSIHLTRAVRLVEDAAEAGWAPAIELCAVFEAMGVARPQNWDGAFDRLQRAAEQGSASAQQQLLILTGTDRELAEDWASVRARISIERLLHHPPRTAIAEAPRIGTVEGFASKAECRWLIGRAAGRLQPALVVDADGRQRPDPGRSNSGLEFPVLEMDVVLEVLRTRISAVTRIPVPAFEPSQLLHYDPGEEFSPHFDFLDAANAAHAPLLRSGQRVATFLVYLNEDFEGGETEFPRAGISLRVRTGDAVFWANVDRNGEPDPMTLHAGRPPTAGEKWILSQWIRDRALAM